MVQLYAKDLLDLLTKWSAIGINFLLLEKVALSMYQSLVPLSVTRCHLKEIFQKVPRKVWRVCLHEQINQFPKILSKLL